MFQRLLTLLVITLVISASSCSKENTSLSTDVKEDPNSYFTATFNGKTLKTSGSIITRSGVIDNITYSYLPLMPILNTSNIGNTVTTNLVINIEGSTINLGRNLYKMPLQQLDALIRIERVGNAVGAYKVIEASLPGLYYSSITDLTVGNKEYDIDPASTTFTVTTADASIIQGTYTGKLIDGTTKIPVNGSFKLRKN